MKTLFHIFIFTSIQLTALSQDRSDHSQITELFRVSNVGVPNAAETRETLIELFDLIQQEYEATVKDSGLQQKFKGPRLRVIKVLDQSKNLYLVAYDGNLSVLEFDNAAELEAGQLTPPLVIAPAGEHSTELQREVAIAPKTGSKKQLKKVSKSSATSFFGIPVGSQDSDSQSSNGEMYKLVTETKILKKYAAELSTEKLDNRPETLSKDMFLDQLKNGGVFQITRNEVRRCPTCNGWRRIKPKDRPSEENVGKISCPTCKEISTIDVQATYQITW